MGLGKESGLFASLDSRNARHTNTVVSKILSTSPSHSRIGQVDRAQRHFDIKRADWEFKEMDTQIRKDYFVKHAAEILAKR